VPTVSSMSTCDCAEAAKASSLTGAGEQFQKHALALVRVWQHAQLEVGFSGPYRDHLAVGAHATLWDGFLMRWISWLRDNIPDIATSASASLSAVMIQRLLEGTLDLAVMYRPGQPPGLTIEHLFDEEFVLVTSAPARSRRTESNYVFVDWGPDFQAEHAAAYPETLPYAVRKRVALARALIARPRLLLLDEPAGGLSAEDIEELAALIVSLPNRACSVMLVEHHMDLVMRVCTGIVVLDFGRVIAAGTPQEIRENEAVTEAYLGAEVTT